MTMRPERQSAAATFHVYTALSVFEVMLRPGLLLGCDEQWHLNTLQGTTNRSV